MHAHSYSYAHPSIDTDDVDDEATIVCPSPFLAMIADQAEADRTPAGRDELGHVESGVIPAAQTKLAKGYPSAPEPVHHTFTEPLRGYPQSAAYVPRHEETNVFVPHVEEAPTMAMPRVDVDATLPPTTAMPAVQPSPVAHGAQPAAAPAATPQPLPQTAAMPTVQPAAVAPPSYGRGVMALPSATAQPEGAQPLVVDSASVSYAQNGQPAPVFTAPAPTPAPPPEEKASGELRVGRALFGALLGAIAGAALWGGVGFVTGGYEFKYGAILIGLFTGFGASRLAGGHSKGVGALGAIFGLAGILTGKALFEVLVQPHLTLGQHIAYHTTVIDLVFYAATIVTGFAVGAGMLSPRTFFRRGRWPRRRFTPSIG